MGSKKLLESQDEGLSETDLEEMFNTQLIEVEASTSTGNMIFNFTKWQVSCTISLWTLVKSMEQSVILKRKIANGTAVYQTQLRELLKIGR